MNKLFKVFIGEIKSIDDGERSVTALISTPTRDRMDEVLLPEGADLKNFRKNPVVLWAHKSSEPPIGRAAWVKKTAEGLLAKTIFATTEKAEEIFTLVKGGFLRAFSVGFMGKEWEDGDGRKAPRRTYKKWELVEYSPVPIPANPDALALALKSGEVKLCDSLKADFDTEYLANILNIRTVDGVQGAVEHIVRHGSGHSEAIVTENYTTAETFLNAIDAAAVYVNASTRFTDGGAFGFGAEVGISTNKLHARGPMGIEGLTTYKFKIYGNGQIR